MASVAGMNSRLLIGTASFGAYTRGFQVDNPTDMLRVTTMDGTNAESYIPGPTNGKASLDLLLDTDTTAGGEFSILNTWYGTPQVATFGIAGIAALSPVALVLANSAQTTITSQATDVVAATVSIETDGTVDAGISLEPLAAVTTTTTGTARDGGAATSNGGVAHLHVTAFSGLTSNTVTIEHSVDGATSWATLGTFTAATGTTSQRLVIAPGTAVRRYTRVVDTVVGVGSCTRHVSFARR